MIMSNYPSPKILRMRRIKGATYERMDTWGHIMGRKMNCPTCGKEMKKGDEVSKGMFIHSGNGWIIREKIYCSDECVPYEIQSA